MVQDELSMRRALILLLTTYIRWPHQFFLRLSLFKQIAISALVLAVFTYWNWQHISQLPGMESAINLYNQLIIRQADKNYFSIVVANMENDPLNEYQQLVVEALKEFDGVQILTVGYKISITGNDAREVERNGHAEAKKYLEKIGSQVMIWGKVLKHGDKHLPKLYWTLSGVETQTKEGRYAPTDDLRLPALFWQDLSIVLKTVVLTQWYARFVGDYQFSEQLPSFIQRMRELTKSSSSRIEWDIDSKALLWAILANALERYGEQSGQKTLLEEAALAYRMSLENWMRTGESWEIARVQNNLGNALGRLSERESGTSRLKEAISLYRQALKQRTRENAPLQWAMTQNNLGVSLRLLGSREKSTIHINESIQAIHEALKEWKREVLPVRWATAQMNLGAALMDLGERENDLTKLQEAVVVLRETQNTLGRQQTPTIWARANYNLGVALHRYGRHSRDASLIEESIAAYRRSLKEWTRERTAERWEEAQYGIWYALIELANGNSSTNQLSEAAFLMKEILQQKSRERAPFEWAETQYNLGYTLMNLGARKSDGEDIRQAIKAYYQALKELSPDNTPVPWMKTQVNLGIALTMLGDRERDVNFLIQAKDAFQDVRNARSTVNDKETNDRLSITIQSLDEKITSLRISGEKF